MSRPPWHFRPVAAFSVLWHLVAAADYLLVKLQVTAYLAWITPDQIAYFTDMPLWANATWAVGVWAGLLAAVLLWQRNRLAALLFALSTGTLIALTAGLVFVRQPGLYEIAGQAGVWLMVGATAAAFLFFLYARALHVRDRRDPA